MNAASSFRIQTKRAPSAVALLVREGGGLVTFQIDVAVAPRIRVNDAIHWSVTSDDGAGSLEGPLKVGSVVSKYGSSTTCFLVVSPTRRSPAPARPAAARPS